MRVPLCSLTMLVCINFAFARRKTLLEKDINTRENEIIVKTHITLRYPNSVLQIQSPVPKGAFRTRRRRLYNSVEPVFEDCRSTNFTRPYTQLKKQVKCKPRDTVVDLVAPQGMIISPNAVVVKRCGGMCNGYKRCLSKKTKDATFYVRTVDGQETYCNSVIVPEDVECRCACEMTKIDCLPTQQYNSHTCSCTCKNNKDYEKCAEREHFKWDSSTCSCSCLYEKACTTGTVWLPNECRCARVQEVFYSDIYE